MLMPKRVKYRRVHRGRMKGVATKGNEVTYYARGYVIYKVGGKYCVAYSDTVARSYVPAAANLTEDA